MVLAEFHAIVKLFAVEHDKQLLYFSPSEIKLHIAAKGNAKKEEVIQAVNARFNLSVTCDNEADSLSLMSLVLHKLYDC